MSFPPGTEMFQFPGFASVTYGFSAGYRISGGFPHSEICGSKGARPSPQLIAACHVLHRLSVPRHPPDALRRLISASSTREAPRTVASALNPGHSAAVHRRLSPQPEQSSISDRSEPKPVSAKDGRSFRLRILFTMSNIRGRRSGLPQLHPELRSVVFSRSSFCRQPLVFSHQDGGGGRDRTDDLMLAKHALSQLSYAPKGGGPGRI